MARRPQGFGPVLLAATCAALLIAQHVAGRACRDALFLSSFGAAALPHAMLAAAGVGLLAVLGTARLMGRFGPGRFVPAFLLLSGAAHLAEWWLLGRQERAAVVLVYLHVSLAGGIAVSGFWSVVNERFDPHTVRHTASRLAAGLAFGGVLGGLAARGLGTRYGLASLLPLFGATSWLAAVGLAWLSRGSSALEATADAPRPAPAQTRRPYLAAMASLVLLVGLASAVVDFVFKATVSGEHTTGTSLVSFFAIFYMVVSIVSVVLQLTLSRWVLAHFGIGAGLAALPATVVALGLFGMALPGALVMALLRGSGVALESSLYRAAYEPLYAPLPLAEKRSKKALIDVACDRLGEALGSGAVLLLAALAPALGLRLALGLAVAASAVACLVALRLERGYVDELAASLRSGQVRLQESEIADVTTRLTLSQTQVELDREALVRQIEELRRGALRQLPGASPRARELLGALGAGDAARINAALTSGPLDVELASLVVPCLERDELSEAAIVALRSIAPRIPGQLVDALLDQERPLKLRKRLPRVLRHVAHPLAIRGLSDALTDADADIRQRAALALSELTQKNPELMPPRRLVLDAAAHELERVTASSLDQVLLLLGLVLEREPFTLALRALGSADPKLRGTALEYLEHVIPEPIRGELWPHLQAGPRSQPSRKRAPADIAAELRRSFS